MYCPDCGTYTDTNFCPNCGKDLRKYRKKPASAKTQPADYSKYLRYYPDTLEAVRRLRIDTGMSSYEAMEIIAHCIENYKINHYKLVNNLTTHGD